MGDWVSTFSLCRESGERIGVACRTREGGVRKEPYDHEATNHQPSDTI